MSIRYVWYNQYGKPVVFNAPMPAGTPGTAGAGHEHTGAGEVWPRARERMVVIVEDASFSRAERRPKRRKTSKVVTRMEMMMRTMMIQVWSIHVSLGF